VIGVAGLPASAASRAVRTWLPLPFILFCYWLAGFYFVDPQPRYEARFSAFDGQVRQWIGAVDFGRRAPRAILEFLELAYFGVYIIVPVGLAAVILAGHGATADRFWTIVLLATLTSYAVLPWIRTRPPWVLQPASPLSSRRVLVRRFNLLLLRRASTHANTFPSGHAAGALATTFAVAAVSLPASILFVVLSFCIMAGAVFGEYHYAGDMVAGAAAAVAAWAVVIAMGV
jgi:membrane-associated phospholipid phosphatase